MKRAFSKLLLLKLLTIAIFTTSFKNNSAPALINLKDSLYAVIYTTGENWDHSKSPNLQPYFRSHSNFLFSLRKEGKIKMGARYSDKGMIIIEAENISAATSMIQKDSALLFKTFKAEVFAFNAFFKGCIE